jgi:type IV pilus assembly protein PilP
MRGVAAWAAISAWVLVLGGCGEDTGELRAWMDQVRRTTQPVRVAVPAPSQFEPFRYDAASLYDPFAPSRLQLGAITTVKAPAASGLKPDDRRRREPLEAFPLDTIRMVGHLSDGRQMTALLQVDSMVYTVTAGNYIGQNYGRIVQVTEQEVKLREMVQDATGDWVERDARLKLQDAASAQEGGRR